MEKNEMYTDKLRRGNRTYFFDIKQSEKKSLYLKITERKKVGERVDYYHIIIYEEDFDAFDKSYRKLISKSKKLRNKESEKAYSVMEIRKRHRQAYLPWTEEDDNKLEVLYCERKTVKELSIIFERNEGAIQSRIKKLKLKEKYND